MWQLGLALAILTAVTGVLTFYTRSLADKCQFGLAAILLANWVANTFLASSLGTAGAEMLAGKGQPWPVYLSLDYVSGIAALALLKVFCERVAIAAVLIALSYALQCIMHVAYGSTSSSAWAEYYYWWALFYVAVAQMLIVGGAGLYDLALHGLGSVRGVSSDHAISSGNLSPPAQEP